MASETLIIAASDNTRAAFASVDRGLSRLQGTFMAFNSLVGVAVVAGLASFIKRTAESGERLDNLSQKLGISVEKLSAFEYALKLNNIPVDTLSTSLTRLASNIQAAMIDKTSQAARLFQIMGVSITDASGRAKSADRVFEELSARFGKMADGVEKTSIATDLLGKSGADLIPAMNNLGSLTKEAERLGAVISTDFAKASAEFGDHLDRMGEQAGRLSRMAVTPLIKSFNELMSSITDVDKRFEKLIAGTGQLQRLGDGGLGGINVLGNNTLKDAENALKTYQQTEEAKRVAAELTAMKERELATEKEKRETETLKRKLDALSDSLLSEKNRLVDDFNEKEAILRGALDRKLIAEEEYEANVLALKDDASKKMEEIEKRRLGISQFYRKADMDSAKFFFGALSNLMQGTSKKQFEIGKKAAIAETIIDTYKAAQGAYAALSSITLIGPVLGAAAAAAAIAAGMGRVNAIRAQQWGGGGGVSGANSGATPTFPANPNTGQPLPGLPSPTTSQQTVQIFIEGNVMTDQFVTEQVIPAIQDAVDNADVVLFKGTSRQAAEIR